MFRAAGVVDENELIKTYRQLGARLQGHPPVRPLVDVATGSLGQGPPDAVGVGLAGKYLDKLPYHVWVLCGTAKPPKAPADVAMPSRSRAIRSAAASSRCLALALTCGAAPSCDLGTSAPLTGGSF